MPAPFLTGIIILPELPEVETTRSGIEPHIKGRKVSKLIVRQAQLRWPIPEELSTVLPGEKIIDVQRRGKYLLLRSRQGTLIIHLGMSGSLRVLTSNISPGKHDHVDMLLEDNKLLRYTDPRRFGCWLWQAGDPHQHPLLASLGPEPLGDDFTPEYLWQCSRGRSAPVKTFIMDSHTVVGVGNIYANEALFMAGISPRRKAKNISRQRYAVLVDSIRTVLARAIKVGGTTLRDFTNSSGDPGYFKQSLQVYGRGGENCRACGEELKEIRLGQRATVYCASCQK